MALSFLMTPCNSHASWRNSCSVSPSSPFPFKSQEHTFLRHTLPSTTLRWIHWMQSKLWSVATKSLHDPVVTMISCFLQEFASAFCRPLNFSSSPTSAMPLPVLGPSTTPYHCYLCGVFLLGKKSLVDLNRLRITQSACSSRFGNRNNCPDNRPHTSCVTWLWCWHAELKCLTWELDKPEFNPEYLWACDLGQFTNLSEAEPCVWRNNAICTPVYGLSRHYCVI